MEPEGSLPQSQVQFWMVTIIITPDNTDLSSWINHFKLKVPTIFRKKI